jgi:AbrB family looped-hinge helix DNA binding protein
MTVARFSTKGQIVVPKELRDEYAFTPGSEVEFVREKDGLKMRPRKPPGIARTTVAEVSGMLAGRYNGPSLSEEDIKRRLEAAIRREWLGEQDKAS